MGEEGGNQGRQRRCGFLIRTGRWGAPRRQPRAVGHFASNSAGLHASCARWLKSRDVAILGWDGQARSFPRGSRACFPIHQLLLIAMGMPIFDNCDFEAVAEAAASRKRWAFLVTASPLAIPGGTGSPLNPIATF